MSEASERRVQEALSAAIDGEASALELGQALNAASRDDELRARWRSAHLIGSVIRGETPAVALPLPALDAVPAAPRRWLGAVAGGAIAATAAVAAALAVVLYFGSGDEAPAVAPPPLLADVQAPPRNLARVPSELDLRRANTYLLHHAQHASVAARPAAMPFVKVLAHDGRPAPVRTAAVAAGVPRQN